MSLPRVFKVENKLAKVVSRPGGKTIKEALQSAGTNIESVRDQCMTALEEKAGNLARIAGGDRGDGAMATLDRLYDVSNAIFGVAGAFGLEALAEAACSLCDVIHRFRSGEAVRWSAVDVHVDGIRLLAGGLTRGADEILEGLRKVRARFVPTT
jgi:hypothetical protein